jgi:hypothetical protein
MGFYDEVVVIFTLGFDTNAEAFDYRTAGQCLPSGAIPLAIVNFNTGIYSEIINSQEPEALLEWLELEGWQIDSIEKVVYSDRPKAIEWLPPRAPRGNHSGMKQVLAETVGKRIYSYHEPVDPFIGKGHKRYWANFQVHAPNSKEHGKYWVLEIHAGGPKEALKTLKECYGSFVYDVALFRCN